MSRLNGTNTCFSGGAKGADTLFGLYAYAANHTVYHYSFDGHRIENTFRRILTGSQLQIADPHILRANDILGRGNFKKYSPYVKNLLRRNYWQIKDSKTVYAVGNMNYRNAIQGGTAWAVQMAIDKGIPIYFFDQILKKWFKHEGSWAEMDNLPIPPHGPYTGIGSRTLTDTGKQAIKELYNVNRSYDLRYC